MLPVTEEPGPLRTLQRGEIPHREVCWTAGHRKLAVSLPWAPTRLSSHLEGLWWEQPGLVSVSPLDHRPQGDIT